MKAWQKNISSPNPLPSLAGSKMCTSYWLYRNVHMHTQKSYFKVYVSIPFFSWRILLFQFRGSFSDALQYCIWKDTLWKSVASVPSSIFASIYSFLCSYIDIILWGTIYNSLLNKSKCTLWLMHLIIMYIFGCPSRIHNLCSLLMNIKNQGFWKPD